MSFSFKFEINDISGLNCFTILIEKEVNIPVHPISREENVMHDDLTKRRIVLAVEVLNI